MLKGTYLGALVSDIVSLCKIPGGTTAGVLIQEIFNKRIETAREILVQELRDGDKDIMEAADVDEVVAILYRYMRAAQEGTARANLRMLARIIAGQKASHALKADKFLCFADIIASLRREELILLGTLEKHGAKNEQNFQDIVRTAKKVMAELIPEIFSSKEEFAATSEALTRTGFVVRTISSTYDCEEPCYLTPLFGEVSKLATFERLFD